MIRELRCDMDESALTLGTIDVSYLPNSSEYSIGRCKHATEEWVSLDARLKAFSLKDVLLSINEGGCTGSINSNRH